MKDVNYQIADITTAENYIWGETCSGWHFVKNNELSVIRESMPPRTKEKIHLHKYAQQFFYILNGTATFEIEGEVVSIRQGQGIHINKGKRHRILNKGHDSLKFLVISQPKSHGDRVEFSNS